VAGEPGWTAQQQSFLRLWCAVDVFFVLALILFAFVPGAVIALGGAE
jgi:hypothetical protein